MPIAVILDEQKRYDLKTAPPDGYVIIRRMTWGESLKKTGMSTKFRMNMGSKKDDNVEAEVDIFQEKVTMWEFANLIVEHNLLDKDSNLLNFKNPVDVAKLNSRTGQEIQKYINDLNDFEDDEDIKN